MVKENDESAAIQHKTQSSLAEGEKYFEFCLFSKAHFVLNYSGSVF